MKVKTSELIGIALDYTVMKCEIPQNSFEFFDTRWPRFFDYSTNWQQGGPIIEREKIDLASPSPIDPSWCAMQWRFSHGMKGPTPLIAAMRCYVASKMGNEIEIPEELVN